MGKFTDPEMRRVYMVLVVFYIVVITIAYIFGKVTTDDWSGRFLGGLALLSALGMPTSQDLNVQGDDVTVNTSSKQ